MPKIVSPPKYNNISTSFGENYAYHIVALKSNYSFFRFAFSMGEELENPFTYLTTITEKNEEHEGYFRVAVASSNQEDNLCYYLIENKTYNYNGCTFIKSNKEKGCTFQTLSLFEEMLYLINKNGLSIYRGEIADYDYLLFAVFNNESESQITEFKEKIHTLTKLKAIDCSSLIMHTKGKKKEISTRNCLRDLFYQLEIYTQNFIQQRIINILAPRVNIPKENIDSIYSPHYRCSIDNINHTHLNKQLLNTIEEAKLFEN